MWGLVAANFLMSASFAGAWVTEQRRSARLLAALLLRDGERPAADVLVPGKNAPKEVPGLQVRPIGLSAR